MFVNVMNKALQSGGFFHQWMRLESWTDRALWIARQEPAFLADMDKEFTTSWVWSPRAAHLVPMGLAAAGVAASAVLILLGLAWLQALPIAMVGAFGAFAISRALQLRGVFRSLCAPMSEDELVDVIDAVDRFEQVRGKRDALVRAGHVLRSAHAVALQAEMKEARRAELARVAAGDA